jgi:hypothetical protein
MNNEPAPDSDIAVIGSIRQKISDMAVCINNAILLNEIVERVAKRHPDADVNRLPLPVFKTNFARIVQLSRESFQMCHILAAFCGFHERRYSDDAEAVAWYTQKFIRDTGDEAKAMRGLALKPLDFLTEFMAEFHAKRREIERLAAEIRDCAEERDAMIHTTRQFANAGSGQSIGEAAEGILKDMANLKTYHDAIDARLEELRNTS